MTNTVLTPDILNAGSLADLALTWKSSDMPTEEAVKEQKARDIRVKAILTAVLPLLEAQIKDEALETARQRRRAIHDKGTK